MDKNSIEYWFPILKETGVLVPETIIVKTHVDFWPWLDGQPAEGIEEFLDLLKETTDRMGYPCFLRTGHISAKHSWKDSCFVESADRVGRSVGRLLEASAMAMPAMPWDVWAVREFLKLDVRFIAFWGDLPIANERRYFIEDGKIVCSHPYWPEEAFETQKGLIDNWRAVLAEMNSEPAPVLDELSLIVAESFEGAWSLDWAKTIEGKYYALDMALAAMSYHWPNCPKAEGFRR